MLWSAKGYTVWVAILPWIQAVKNAWTHRRIAVYHPERHTRLIFSSPRTLHTSKTIVFSLMANNPIIRRTLFKECSWKENACVCVCVNFLRRLSKTTEQFLYGKIHSKSTHFSPFPLLCTWGKPPSPLTDHIPTASSWSSSGSLPIRFTSLKKQSRSDHSLD